MPVDREDLRRTLSALVRINSINPTLVAGAPGERDIAAYVAQWLSDAGLAVEIVAPEPSRPSVAARLPGTGGGRSLMLNAHMDTVDVVGMAEPFSGDVRDGKLYGRGAYDMKGSLAACMLAAKTVSRAVRLKGDLIVTGVADEEYGSLGTMAVLERIRADAAIVTEPTSLRVCRAHKGYIWIRVTIEGRAAHGSRFEQGIDANVRMGRFLCALEELSRELIRRSPHPLVGPPSLHAALLQGGSGLSTYAASSEVQIERRTVPGETVKNAMAEIEAILDRLRHEDPTFQARAEAFFSREPFEVDRTAGIVKDLDAATAAVLGKPAEHFGDTPWMDSALTSAAGIPTVVFGPHGAGAHADVEWVDLDSVARTAEVLVAVARSWCGVSS